MPIPVALLEGVGRSALPLLAGELSVMQIGSAIASNAWKWWSKRKEAKERRAELEALAQATASEVRTAVKEVVAELADGRSQAEQSRLEAYLVAIPAQLRRTLRRPSDISGRTIPLDLALAREEDLVPLLPARPPRFVAGDRVADFELVELLGIGGFGEVWKAQNVFMPGAPPVALKFCIDADAAASLRQETTLLDRIQWEGTHPGIVHLRHTFLSTEPPFLEYELVEGGDLGGLIVEWHRQKGGPSPAEATKLIQRLAEIVAFAHARGIIHRDLKPANILVQGDATSSPRLKIADFGIGAITADAASRVARLTGATSTRTAAAANGGYSLYYASPEQVRGAPADPRDDVHAIGMIWYQLLVGDLTAEAPRGAGWKKRLAAKGMSVELIELLEACLSTDREDRPANATEVAEQIRVMLAGGTFTAGNASRLGHSPEATKPAASTESVLPLEAIGRVAGNVAEKMHQVEKERRPVKFLAHLRPLLAALSSSAMKNGTLRNVVNVVIALLFCGGIGGLGGCITDKIIFASNHDFNNEEAERIARNHSTEEFILRALKEDSPNYSKSPPTKELNWVFIREFYLPDGRYIRPLTIRVQQTPSGVEPNSPGVYEFKWNGDKTAFRVANYSLTPSERTRAETAVIRLNGTLGEVATEWATNARPHQPNPWAPGIVGVGSGLLMLFLLLLWALYLHHREAKRLAQTIDTTIAQLDTEFPVDMAEYRKHVDLRDPDAVRELIAQVERHTATT